MIVDTALAIFGLILLSVGGYILVAGGAALAKRLQISSMVIGLTVVAYGTSTPELAASLTAAFTSHTDLILGNIIGSNISNIGMVIGISAIIATGLVIGGKRRDGWIRDGLGMRHRVVTRWLPIMIAVSILMVVLSIDGEISQIDGVILIILLIAFTLYIIKTAKKQTLVGDVIEDEDPSSDMAISRFKVDTVPRAIFAVVIGAVLLFMGGDMTVGGAINIAKDLGISELVIGVVIVAIGTSLPELITSVIAIRKKQMDIGIGNIVGSNIYNILLIGGISATLIGIPVSTDVFSNYYIMIAFSLVLFIGFRKVIPRFVGIGLAIAFVAYLVSLLV
jgi:cation:H+ antiporter